MSVEEFEEFEELERYAPETVGLEFIRGKVQVKPGTDGDHDHIVAWLQRLCMRHRPELWLYGDRGVRLPDGAWGLVEYGGRPHGGGSDVARLRHPSA